MWFKNKQRNRRLGRDHVLEVKLRSSQVRSARARMAALALAIVFGTVLGLYGVWRLGHWGLDELVYENPAFNIRTIEIKTEGIIPTEQLRRWAAVKPGQNLLALDLARVKRDLELVPLIRSASIERILPDTLIIRVIEREPIARLQVPRMHPQGGVGFVEFQLDTEGFVLMPLESAVPPPATGLPGAAASRMTNDSPLPLITGLTGSQIQTGRQIDHPQALAAVRLILALDNSPMAGLVDFREIRVDGSEALTVATGQGSEVTFALHGLDQQLRRWRGIHDYSLRSRQTIVSLDLAVSNSIPARLAQVNPSQPAPPKPVKTSRNRKKHV